MSSNKYGCSHKFKRIYIYIYIYISVVSVWNVCLKLLRVVLVFHLYLYLFWWGSCLGVTLVSISISTSSTVPACLISIGYVAKFVWCACMFNSRRMCTSSVLYGIYACIFNSQRICAQVMHSSFLTCMGFHACMFNSLRICAQILTCIGFVSAYSILEGYVHNFCILTCLTIFGWKIHWRYWRTHWGV